LALGSALEVIGPVCTLLNFHRRQAALLFIFYVIVTAVLFHNFWSFPFNSDAREREFLAVPQELRVAGGFLYIAPIRCGCWAALFRSTRAPRGRALDKNIGQAVMRR
jgi:uncharacterized membrane protein YphA (DoxX/SURF4 family)